MLFSRLQTDICFFLSAWAVKLGRSRALWAALSRPDLSLELTVRSVISMDEYTGKRAAGTTVRDRRYAIRYPFAADAEMLDLESGARTEGVTSDISLGGCFVCTSRPLPVRSRVRLTLSRKGQKVEMLASVRVVKPRIGMGLEFLDLDAASHEAMLRWIETLRKSR